MYNSGPEKPTGIYYLSQFWRQIKLHQIPSEQIGKDCLIFTAHLKATIKLPEALPGIFDDLAKMANSFLPHRRFFEK